MKFLHGEVGACTERLVCSLPLRHDQPCGGLARFSSSTLLPFFFLVPLLKPNSRKKGTLITEGLLGNLVGQVNTRSPIQFLE